MDRLPGLLTSEEMTLADVLYNDGELHPERFPTDDTRLIALVRQKIRNSQGKCYHVSIILCAAFHSPTPIIHPAIYQ